ncbi:MULTISPECIES: hypothetical protein [Methylobacterium]|uniref:hypothetical protein n=1 Tax=Methylobacterium TaxID=407 RepID=UPI00272ED94D|nr:hypothetical protein [Methylobacterium sp.]
MNPASYQKLPQELYSIGYANFLYRRPGTGGWYNGGDMDNVGFNLSPTRKQRYGKDGNVSYLATEKTTRIDPQLSAKFMQETAFVRAASLLGVPLSVKQDAGDFTQDIDDLVPGMYYWTGVYGASDPVIEYSTGAAALAILDPSFYRLSDPALGVIQLLRLPPDAKKDVGGKVPGRSHVTVTAGDAAAATEIDVGTEPEVEMEVMIRMVSDIGQKGVLHLYQWNASPDGEKQFVTQNEDFEGTVLKGRCVKTDKGIGRWRSLAA